MGGEFPQFFFYWFIDGVDDNENRHGTQLKLIKFQTVPSISMEILSKEIKKVVFMFSKKFDDLHHTQRTNHFLEPYSYGN